MINEPVKSATGYRQYPTEVIVRIQLVKRAQQSGFTLARWKEIAELLPLDGEHCEGVQKIAEQKRQQIDEQLRGLIALRNVLDSLVRGCQQDKSTQHWSLIDAFSNQKDAQSGSFREL